MKVIVDTSIWSLVFRRKKSNSHHIELLSGLIDTGRVIIIGPIRQEILSGIKSKDQFDLLKKYLSAFPDHPIKKEDYELAAEFFNKCRAKGIQGSNTDFLICSIALKNDFYIYTADKDFINFNKELDIKLYE